VFPVDVIEVFDISLSLNVPHISLISLPFCTLNTAFLHPSPVGKKKEKHDLHQ
jgi:hypothetical protein